MRIHTGTPQGVHLIPCFQTFTKSSSRVLWLLAIVVLQLACGGGGGGGNSPVQPPVTPPPTTATVNVTSADVTKDAIAVTLGPSGSSGTLKVELVGATTALVKSDTRQAGDHTVSFNLPSIGEGEYTAVRATWTVGTSTATKDLPYHIYVLGTYRHSQYNTPHEVTCTGADVKSYITTGQCWAMDAYINGQLREQFVSQVNMNGSGTAIDYGPVMREFWCLNQPGVPMDASERSFRKSAPSVSCSGMALDGTTVARCKNDTRLNCGDKVYIAGVGIKTVTDTCPACCGAPEMKQLDNFTADNRCSGIVDLGRFVTVKVY